MPAEGAPAAPSGEHRFEPCPDRPNCVSSIAQGKAHVAPLVFADAPDVALSRLKAILRQMPRVRIVREAPDYVHAEASSRVFRFVDDLEFGLDAAAGVIHVRSAARLGYSDFGVNRRRVEAIRERFART
jgi:uncharacterized protein (DUF1499 family)